MNAQYLLNLLKESGYIDQAQASQLQDDEIRSGKPIVEVIVDNGLHTEDEIYEIIAHVQANGLTFSSHRKVVS